jgi:hypothetical protein
MSEPNGNARRADSTEAKRERSYLEGRRRAYIDMLMRALEALGYRAHKAKVGLLVAEMEEAKQSLRDLCERHGDNDWRNDEHLADIIEKHLGRYLDTPSSTDRGDEESDLDTDRYVSACEHCPCAQFVTSVSSVCGVVTADQYACGLDRSIAWEEAAELHVPPDTCPMRRGVVRLRLAP